MKIFNNGQPPNSEATTRDVTSVSNDGSSQKSLKKANCSVKIARRQKHEKTKLSEIFGQKFSKLLHMKRDDGNETASKTLNMPEIKIETSNTSGSPDLNSPIRSDVLSSGEGSRFNRLTSKVQSCYYTCLCTRGMLVYVYLKLGGFRHTYLFERWGKVSFLPHPGPRVGTGGGKTLLVHAPLVEF